MASRVENRRTVTPVELSRSEKLNFANKDESTNQGEQCWKCRYHQYNRMLQNVTEERHSVQSTDLPPGN